ncbi:MAG: hypothetical protein J6T47_10155, partial [Lachnospiraceae bacterium]|nr:hypothetical protein [Lachnospiraceae bacterium]
MNRDGFSILDLYGEDHAAEANDSIHQDLNLSQVVDHMAARFGRNVRKFFTYMPEDVQEVKYRRAVYTDVKKEAVQQALLRFTAKLTELEQLRKDKDKVLNNMQKNMWEIRETAFYCDMYVSLKQELSEAQPESEGLKDFLQLLEEILAEDLFQKSIEETGRILKEIRELRFLITYDRDRLSVVLGEVPGQGAYEEWLSGAEEKEVTTMPSPYGAEIPLCDLELACLSELEDKKPQLFKAIRKSKIQAEPLQLIPLKRFEKEILFYLAYVTMQQEMEAAGFAFCTPKITEGRKTEAEGLYDLALALTSLKDGRIVVSNDFEYKMGEKFFVLTGPNQGGKTTFARSLGQLIFLTKMGLDVPARSATVPCFAGLMTHFSVEESVETGRGKLMEELVRLAPMMKINKKGSFVVINELFTTAANYDAQIMGKRVLEHFIAMDCMGIYV